MNYTENSARARLTDRKLSCPAVIAGKAISITYAGIKLLGAIDYLVKHHGYRWVKDAKE